MKKTAPRRKRPSKKELHRKLLRAAADAHVPRRKLRIELVPKPLHGENLRKLADKHHWGKLRARLLEGHPLKCDICVGSVEKSSQLNAHENWDYYVSEWPALNVLSGISFVCGLCHSAEHFMHTQILVQDGKLDPGYLDDVIEHYCRVNKVTSKTFFRDLESACERWERLSELEWLTHFGEYSEWLLEVLDKRAATLKRLNELDAQRGNAAASKSSKALGSKRVS